MYDDSPWLRPYDRGIDPEIIIPLATVVDSTRDMLSVGGFKLFSGEVEEKPYEPPAIELCAIVGAPNPRRPGTDLVKPVVQPAAA